MQVERHLIGRRGVALNQMVEYFLHPLHIKVNPRCEDQKLSVLLWGTQKDTAEFAIAKLCQVLFWLGSRVTFSQFIQDGSPNHPDGYVKIENCLIENRYTENMAI